jgi:hypothetical protein
LVCSSERQCKTVSEDIPVDIPASPTLSTGFDDVAIVHDADVHTHFASGLATDNAVLADCILLDYDTEAQLLASPVAANDDSLRE